MSQPVLGIGRSVGIRASTSTASTQRPKARRQARKAMAGVRRCLAGGVELWIILIASHLKMEGGGAIIHLIRYRPQSILLSFWT